MFLLDSLLISGLRWTLDTIRTAADHELHDDSALRERLLDAEMRRELGEIDDETFRTIEADVLSRLRAIREARGGGSAAFELGAPDGDAAGGFSVEATVAGDFHEHPSGTAPLAPGRDHGSGHRIAARRPRTRAAGSRSGRRTTRGGRPSR